MLATLLVRLTAEFTIRSILRESRICNTHEIRYPIVLLFSSDLSERLNLSQDEGEKWIVNLIRETRMGADAKIDLEKVCSFSACYKVQLLNKTHRMSSRSTGHHYQSTNPSLKRRAVWLSVRKPSVPPWRSSLLPRLRRLLSSLRVHGDAIVDP